MTRYATNLASEFYVLSALYRVGLDAYLTLGNKKAVDIVVSVPGRGMITVEVKGVAASNPWPADNIKEFSSPTHYYVFVCFEGKIEQPQHTPSSWIIPSSELEPFVQHYTTRRVVAPSLLKLAGEKYKEAWHQLANTPMLETRGDPDSHLIEGFESPHWYDFEGFVCLKDLQADVRAGSRGLWQQVPDLPGVYCLLRKQPADPEVLEETNAFPHPAALPLPLERVEREWVSGSNVLYIGKTGRSLRKRLREYVRFGLGFNVGHRGGRLVWQLADSEDLIVAWKVTEEDDPDEVESELIHDFRKRYGRRPFANLNK